MSGADQNAEALVLRCEETVTGIQDGLDWLRRFPDRVGVQVQAVEKELRKSAVEARKLGAADGRPMAVGVYGLSQAGKSYLISTLARPEGKSLTALLDGPRPFLKDINPESDKEATGLVTRFTMRRDPVRDERFPVRIRLLTEIDLVKILANSWFCDSRDPEAVGFVVPEDARAVLEAAERDAQPADGAEIAREDVWDLQDYCEREFRAAEAFRTTFTPWFWDRASAVLPRLSPERRVGVYALLWNSFAPFTALLGRLLAKLRDLGFSRDAWAPIDALVPKEVSVLKVDTLDDLHRTDTPQIEIISDAGARCRLTRPELTALIAELQITMSELPWDFLEKTDLLDFPGARERMGRNHEDEIGGEPGKLGIYFLRGKVAYLFDRYADERELNALLLCIKESNNAFDKTVRSSIRGWIHKTHGDTPDARSRVPTTLFAVLTRMDMHFNRTEGRDVTASTADLWDARIKASIVQPLAEHNGWLDEWHPGKPFANTLLARNPGRSQSLSVIDADGRETLLPGIAEQAARWGADFAAHHDVQRYVSNPARAWAEVFTANDAGMGYLVERLAPACQPGTKLAQIENQIRARRESLRRLLEPWHISEDLDEQVNQRLGKLDPSIEAISNTYERFGTLLSMLHLTPAEAADVILKPPSRAPAARAEATGPKSAQPAGPPPRTRSINRLDALIQRTTAAPEPATGVAAPFVSEEAKAWAAGLTAIWGAKLKRFSSDPELRAAFDLDPTGADALVMEIMETALRCGVEDRMARQLTEVKGTLSFIQAAPARAMVACRALNEVVTYLGHVRNGAFSPDRPRPSPDDPPVFASPEPPVSGFEVPAHAAPSGAVFVRDWLRAIEDAVDRNVRTRGGGGPVNPDDSKALSAVLKRLA